MSPGRNGLQIRVALMAVLLATVGPTALSGQAGSTEVQVVAAYVYRFGQYVEWPEGSEGAREDIPFIIGVWGERSYVDELARVVEGKSLGGRSIEVRSLGRPDEVDTLAILFLSTEDPLEIGRGLSAAGDAGILTVGFAEGFAERGGVINIVREQRRLRFEVNVDAAERAGLRVSSQLLRLAIIIGDPE